MVHKEIEMNNIMEIIQDLMPILAVAITTSALTTISVQGFKNFFMVEIKGLWAQISTVIIVIIWSYILVVYYGEGTWTDFVLNIIMTFLGATGIYEVIMQNKSVEK